MLYWVGGIMKPSESSNYLGPRYFLKVDWTWSLIPQSETFRLGKMQNSSERPIMKLRVISSPNHEEVMKESDKRRVWF
jgi:hypothetical protein